MDTEKTSDWLQIGNGLTLELETDWEFIDVGLTSDWGWIDTKFALDWHWSGTGLAALTSEWYYICNGLAMK